MSQFSMQSARVSLISIPLIFLITGCSTPILISSSAKETAAENAAGMVYSLPKGQLQLTASRKLVDDDDVAAAQKNAKDSAAVLETVKDALKKAKDDAQTAKEKLASVASNHDTPATVRADFEKAAALTAAVLAYLTEKTSADAKVATAAAERAAELAKNKGKWLETIEVTQLPVVADSTRQFITDLNHKGYRDDKVKVTVSNGLLSSSNVTSTDQSAAVILNIVSAAAALKTPASFGPRLARSSPVKVNDKNQNQCTAYAYSAIFDPTNAKERYQVLTTLNRRSDYVVTIDGISCYPDLDKTMGSQCDTAQSDKGQLKDSPAGLVYRAQRSVRVTVSSKASIEVPVAEGIFGRLEPFCELPSNPLASSQTFVVPDSKTEFFLGSTAGPFTKNVFDSAFKDGMPTEYAIEKPSEFVAYSSLPLDVLKAIISVPASIIKLRVDYDSQATAQITGQTAAINAEIARMAAQQALDQAIESSGSK